jgi:hypothetical protein
LALPSRQLAVAKASGLSTVDIKRPNRRQQLANELLKLRPAVAQFDRGVPHPMDYTVYHRELPEGVVRAVNFFTKDFHGGCDVNAVRQRWQAITDAVK